jgi:hypothetical protein
MDYYRLTIPIPKQPWQWLRFRISTILLLVAILAIFLAWRRDHQQLTAEIYRLQYPYPHYQASQAVGEPDANTTSDSPRAWCPAQANSGSEWLVLDFDEKVPVSQIVVHENLATGAIVRITDYPVLGPETTLWQGTDSPQMSVTSAVSTMPVAGAAKTNRIKVYLDTSQITGWAEIDAVGLVDENGRTTWASGAKASSTWGQPQTSQFGWGTTP